MKKGITVIVSLCIGAIIGYLYKDYKAGKEYEITKVSAVEKNNRDNVPLYTNDSDWDRLMEEMIWNEMNEFGPV